jgi:NADH-quinone oxidoreductase subunit C
MDIRTPISTLFGDWNERFGDTWKAQVSALKERFPSAIEEVRMPMEYPTDVPIVYVKKENLAEVLTFVKSEPGFEYNFLADYTASDEGGEFRFELIINLFSANRHWRIRFKTRLKEGEECPTLISVWPGANWAEREIWDMFGVKFTNHPDLRRILMDQRWEGHPLRKDYPLRGYQVFTTPEPIDPKLLE